MAKFDNAKVGDRVFSTIYGWGKVFSVDKTDVHFPLVIEFDKNIRMCYRSDGTTNGLNKFPNLFWNEVKLPTDEEDKKPFDLVEFLRENLEPKEFKKMENNHYLYYDTSINEWRETQVQTIDFTTVFFKSVTDNIILELSYQKIKPHQLKQAYKELGWL